MSTRYEIISGSTTVLHDPPALDAHVMIRCACVLALCVAACGRADSPRRSAQDSGTTAGGNAVVSVTRPTVIAYFVIPSGAVDTLPDLAVEADDWNVSMATLGDSLEAAAISLAIVTDSAVRLSLGNKRDTAIALGTFRSSGYIYARPGRLICVRPGGADVDSVLAVARVVARGGGCA